MNTKPNSFETKRVSELARELRLREYKRMAGELQEMAESIRAQPEGDPLLANRLAHFAKQLTGE